MNFDSNPSTLGRFDSVARSDAEVRAEFLKKTYFHLAGSIWAFMLIEWVLLQLPVEGLVAGMIGSPMSWLLVLGGFMGVSYIASRWALDAVDIKKQYMGLGLYVVAEAVIFLPLLYVAKTYYPDVIPAAGLLTLIIFTGLSGVVFMTRKDFSFMGGVLRIATFVALGVIVGALLFGFSLGLLFTCLMIALASGYVLYETSNVLHHYRPGQHVAASLALFASVALLFWYILQLLMRLQSRD